ncbi:sensor histidine kinase [Hymenobacter ginkgonis]|nr:PAS domain-containing sensor histidine kinase [Hymenobacter ginkgonis]
MFDLPLPEHCAMEAQIQALRAELAQAHEAQRQQEAQREEITRDYHRQLRFRTIFEHSPLGQKIIDADLTIRQANAAIADLLGLESPLELLGHAILEYAHPDHYADWARLQEALWAHHLTSFTLETRLVRPDGALLWCRVTSVLFPDEGGELGYTTLENISERKLLEDQVDQHANALQDANEQLAAFNEELQVANEELLAANMALGRINAELDTFVYAASHDLRAPIGNLQGLVQVLVAELSADTPQLAQAKPILDLMQESMARFGHTLDRLADFSIAYTPDGLVREHLELAAVLEEVRQEVAPLLAATQGQLLVDIAGTSSLWFAAKHVYSVMLNLVSNALKYRHPDRAPVVRVRSHREQGRLVVRVQDNGLGLSHEQQDQLFRLFKRLHSHVEGTGVGLYLVKKILDNAGGSIQVESELGRGSTFIVNFPG